MDDAGPLVAKGGRHLDRGHRGDGMPPRPIYRVGGAPGERGEPTLRGRIGRYEERSDVIHSPPLVMVRLDRVVDGTRAIIPRPAPLDPPRGSRRGCAPPP